MTTDPAVRPHAHFGDDYSPDRCAWTEVDGTKCDVPLRQSAATTDPAVTAAAEAIIAEWKRVEPDHSITQYPASYIATFVDLAIAAVAAARPIIAAETAQLRAKLDAIHRLCEPYHTEETTFVRADDILVIIDGGTS